MNLIQTNYDDSYKTFWKILKTQHMEEGINI